MIRVKSIFTEEIWKNSFLFPNTIYSYSTFLRAVAKFPMFCNEVGDTSISLDDACKRELAALLAHISVTTGDL